MRVSTSSMVQDFLDFLSTIDFANVTEEAKNAKSEGKSWRHKTSRARACEFKFGSYSKLIFQIEFNKVEFSAVLPKPNVALSWINKIQVNHVRSNLPMVRLTFMRNQSNNKFSHSATECSNFYSGSLFQVINLQSIRTGNTTYVRHQDN